MQKPPLRTLGCKEAEEIWEKLTNAEDNEMGLRQLGYYFTDYLRKAESFEEQDREFTFDGLYSALRKVINVAPHLVDGIQFVFDPCVSLTQGLILQLKMASLLSWNPLHGKQQRYQSYRHLHE